MVGTMKLLDLCSGREGVSKEFRKYGWDVTTVDINPKFNPNIVADINTLHLESPGYYDFIWASPVCTEYTKSNLPISWKCNGGKRTLPDMCLFLNCYRIIRYLNPKWWAIENVIGAVPYFSLVLGKYQKHVGSRYLWGEFPIFDTSHKHGKWRLPPTADRSEIRSEIPTGLAKALCLACENQITIEK
jgi:hypothetical protein